MADTRLRLEFEACVGSTRVFLRRWFQPREDSHSISDLASQIAKEFALGGQELTLTLKGFQLAPDSPLSVLRDDDIISVSGTTAVQIAGTALDFNATGAAPQLLLRSSEKPEANTNQAAAKRRRAPESSKAIPAKRGKISHLGGCAAASDQQQDTSDGDSSSEEETSDASGTPPSAAQAATPAPAIANDGAPATGKASGQSRNARRKKVKRRLIREGVLPKPARKTIELPPRSREVALALPPLPRRGEPADSSDPHVAEFLRTGHVRFDESDDEPAAAPGAAEHDPPTLQPVATQSVRGERGGEVAPATSQTHVADPEEDGDPPVALDFDALPRIDSPPQPGTVLSYKILEISASLTPEVSGWRCGKVTEVHPDSSFALEPWPDRHAHPAAKERPIRGAEQDSDEEEPEAQQESQYGEDGVLQADMSTFLDVRVVHPAPGDAGGAPMEEHPVEASGAAGGDGNDSNPSEPQPQAAATPIPAAPAAPGMLPRVLRQAQVGSLQGNGPAAAPSPAFPATPAPIHSPAAAPGVAQPQQPGSAPLPGGSAGRRLLIRPIPRIQRGASHSPASHVASRDTRAEAANGSAQAPASARAADQGATGQDEILAMIAQRKAELSAAGTPLPGNGEQSGQLGDDVGASGGSARGKTAADGVADRGTPGPQVKFKTRLKAATLGRFLTKLRAEED